MPQLEGIKGELKAVNTRIDALDSTLGAKIDALNTKVEVYRRQLVAEIRRVEETLSADFVRIESNVDVPAGLDGSENGIPPSRTPRRNQGLPIKESRGLLYDAIRG